ncbi:MAG: hypothetical protein AB8A46_08725 [Prochlorococcus sp.]
MALVAAAASLSLWPSPHLDAGIDP